MARQLEHFDNLVAMFYTRAAEKGDAPFLWAKLGGAWVATSWADAARQVASLAAGLKAIGLKPGDRVMLVSENRPEWCISDLAIMAAGCVTVPTYTTNTERDHTHIIENSGARAVIVSDAKLGKMLLPAVLRAEHATRRDRDRGIPDRAARRRIPQLAPADRGHIPPTRRGRPARSARTWPASSTPAAPAARRAG